MPTDTIAGVADFGWFANYMIDTMTQLNIGPNVLPIFLTDNVMLYDGSYLNCCTIGFHGTPAAAAASATREPAGGAADADVLGLVDARHVLGLHDRLHRHAHGARARRAGIADIHALSHEVAEALDDPFVDNYVVPWLTPTAPQYGCTPCSRPATPSSASGTRSTATTRVRRTATTTTASTTPRRRSSPSGTPTARSRPRATARWDGRLTFMGPRTTGLGGPYAGFGDYSQGC